MAFGEPLMAAKKGPQVGSGGQRRKALQGRGPTPPARERPGHPAQRRSAAPARTKRTDRSPDAPELVTGRNPVVEALRARVPATGLQVAVGVEPDPRLREALRLAGDRGIPILEVPKPSLDRLPGVGVHQGVALTVAPYDYVSAEDLLARTLDAAAVPLLVALDGVTDPRNLGAIVRSAAAFGAHGVLVPERRAAKVTATAWKASAGALARVPVARCTNLVRTLKSYAAAGLLVVGLAAEGELDLSDLEAAVDPLVLVIGSEGRGLSRLVGETCDLGVTIPMTTGTESLNASVAAGVALYEVARRRAARGRL
jgi:23S rRNA (guanosine2251-2'-O)-methyltransferase